MTTESWVWITGVTGFSGPFLAQELKNRKPQARILGLGRQANSSAPVDKYQTLDLLDGAAIQACCEAHPPAEIYHLAAAMPPASDAEMWHQNVAMTYELLTALARAGYKQTKILSVGSAAELEARPGGAYLEQDRALGATPYGKSKAAQMRIAQALALELGLSLYFARTFNLLGPRLPEKWVAGRLCRQLATSKEKLILGNLQAERDFVDIRDVAVAYCAIMEHGQQGELYNVCSGNALAISRLVDIACELLGEESPHIESDAIQLSRTEVSSVYGDPAKIFKATGWQPSISVKESLRDMLESYRNV